MSEPSFEATRATYRRLCDERTRTGLREACDAAVDVVSALASRVPEEMSEQPVLGREVALLLGRQIAFCGMLAEGATPLDAPLIGLAMAEMHDIFAEIGSISTETESGLLAWVAEDMKRCAGFFRTALEENGFGHLLIGRGG